MSKSYQTTGLGQPTSSPDVVQAASRRAWVLTVLQRRPDLLARLTYFHEQLRRMPRAQRRWLARRVAMPLSAAALMLALSGAPIGLRAETAATITVDNLAVAAANDGLCSLIEAINNANATSGTPHADCDAGSATGSDTIVFPTNGTFNVTTYNNYGYYGYNGLPEVTSAIVIEGNGSTIARTGKDEYRLLSVAASGDLTLNNVTVTGGDSGYYYGGAIMVQEGTLVIVDSTITGNEAEGGGALYSLYGNVTITGSALNDNTAYSGSAISAIYSQLTISDSELNDNRGPNGFGGAAIYSLGDGYYDTVSGNVSITNTTISGNTNDGGGALMVTFGDLELLNSTISNNTTKEGYGGGLYLNGTRAVVTGTTISGNKTTNYSGAGVAVFGGDVTITDSVINNNDSGYLAGGLYAIDAEVTINQTTISNNSAALTGGGVMAYSGELTITNTTISSNSAESGGGIYNRGPAMTTIVNSTISQNEADNGGGAVNSGTLQLINTTVTGNEATAGVGGGVLNTDDNEMVGALVLSRSLIAGNVSNSGGQQVDSSGATATVTANNFNVLGSSAAAGVVGFTAGATDIVPTVAVTAVLESALADNGGPTMTHALVDASPALDAAPSGACEIAPVNGRDQRGAARTQDANESPSDNECDIGAYEFGDNFTIGYKLFLPAVLRQ